MSRYIATYDISVDASRTTIAKVLMKYGDRIQKSVFEVWLEPDELPELRRLVGPYLRHEDQFELIPIDLSPARDRWRWGEETDDYPAVVVLGH